MEQTSLLLSNVYNLTERVGGEDGDKLDQAGVKVVGSAQVLLKTAEVSLDDSNLVYSHFISNTLIKYFYFIKSLRLSRVSHITIHVNVIKSICII